MKHTFRNAHVLYVSPNWVENRGRFFEAEDFVNRLKAAHAECIEFYAKDYLGISYYDTKVGLPYGKDLIGPLVEESHRAGLRFIAYYCIYWDKHVWQSHPEWRAPGWMTINGDDSGIVWPVSMDSGYRDYVLAQLEEIAEHYEIDGMWLDMPAGDLRAMKDVIKKHRPNALVTWNNDQNPQAIVNRKDRYDDFISMEAHGPDYAAQSLISRLLRREGKPFEITSPGTTEYWGGWSLKPANMLKVEAATVMANGGCLTVGMNPYPDGRVEPAEVENLGSLWRWIEPRESYLIDATTCADVGVIADGDLSGLNAALVEHHIQFDYIDEDVDLSKYRLVFWPDTARVSEDRLREYVHAGGKAIVCFTGCKGLEDVLGLNVVGKSPYSGCYLRPTDPEICKNYVDYPILLRSGESIQCRLTEAESWGRIEYPIAELTLEKYVGFGGYNPPCGRSKFPMITCNKFGEGKAVFFAATLVAELSRSQQYGSPWLKQVVANLINRLLGEPVLRTDAAPGVEIVMTKQRDRYLIHMINRYAGVVGANGAEHSAPRMHDTNVWINKRLIDGCVGVYSGMEEANVQSWGEEEWIRINVQSWDTHAILLLS